VIGSEECETSIARAMVNPSKAIWEDLLKLVLGDAYEMLCA
jgi:hypothetical protein